LSNGVLNHAVDFKHSTLTVCGKLINSPKNLLNTCLEISKISCGECNKRIIKFINHKTPQCSKKIHFFINGLSFCNQHLLSSRKRLLLTTNLHEVNCKLCKKIYNFELKKKNLLDKKIIKVPYRLKKIISEEKVVKNKFKTIKKVQKSLKDDKNLELLGKHPDKYLALQWNVSTSTICNWRQKLQILSFVATKLNVFKQKLRNDIIEYIRENKECISRKHFCDKYAYTFSLISCGLIRVIANEIKVDILYKKSINLHPGPGRCKCEVCKLTRSIKTYFYYNYKKNISLRHATYLANNNIEFYKNNKSRYNKEFYKQIEQQAKSYMFNESRKKCIITS